MGRSTFAYISYADIPVLTKEYLLTVADAMQIEQIPLEDINAYLNGLDEYYLRNEFLDVTEATHNTDEWLEGWVQ